MLSSVTLNEQVTMMSTISRKFTSHVFVCLRLCHCLCHFLLITLIKCLRGHKYPKSLIEGVFWMHICLCHCLHLSFFYQIRSEKDFERYVALQKIINKKMTVLAIEAKSSQYCWLIHMWFFFQVMLISYATHVKN